MTAFSITMSCAIRTFGGAPANTWLSYNWNAFKWGEGTATIPKNVRMAVNTTNLSAGSTAAVNYRFVHQVVAGPVGSADSVFFRYYRVLAESFAQTGAVAHLYLQDPNNYFRVFPEQAIDLTTQSVPSWASISSTPVTWTTAVAGSTTWS